MRQPCPAGIVAPEVKTRVVLGDLIADLVAPLLAVALQLLSVLDAVGTIVGQILAAPACRKGTNAGSANPRCTDARQPNAGGANARSSHARRANARSGWKLCHSGPATTLQEIGCGAAGARPGTTACTDSAGRGPRHIQEVVQLAGRGAGQPRQCFRPVRPRRRPVRAADHAPAARTRCAARARARASRPARTARGASRGSCCTPCFRPWKANGRPPPTFRHHRRLLRRPAAATSAAASAATSKDVVLHEKKGRSDEYQESRNTFHVITWDLF